ncbi:non-specific serine/threonine protein kinase [Malassezia caprae]|uniref:Non-specific serine/threonine protein kinase n=1 Tax=Malassezia caprae TaxID=1381934 RepID=A0AAF0IX10_9BASI|nr:non-specific serine/threonine protein kinase [Malassezia caprae]
MAPPRVQVKFLGTSTTPVPTRNYSSEAVMVGSDRSDCGEGTQRQLFSADVHSETKLTQIHTILITHLHPDRLRAFLRTNLSISYATLNSYFVVHELLFPSQPAYPHDPIDQGSTVKYTETDEFLPEDVVGQERILPIMPPHEKELPGRNIVMDRNTGAKCIELYLSNKDDASNGLSKGGMVELAQNADLLVHECTYASMSDNDLDLARKVSEDRAQLLQNALLRPDDAKTRALSRGHSVPEIDVTIPEPATKKEKDRLEEEHVPPTSRSEPDDIDDMFALDNDRAWEAPSTALAQGGKNDARGPDKIILEKHATASGVGLHDNWDDPDGYYRVILGEKLDQRYQVYSILGRGIFASVVRAKDLKQNGRDVAIKIARRQETMFKAGMKEIGNLRLLADADPDDKMFVVRLENHFEHRGHLCMVFESLGLNLREIVKRFGKDVGLHMQAVKTYAKQMFMALVLLRKENIIHADIKPDNILVNEAKTVAKLADLGSATRTTEMEITPYLVSRFYRAPEIILGQPYGCEIDMWSMGCTVYELASGKILFPGKTNNHMFKTVEEIREVDSSTGEELAKRVNTSQPTEDLRAKLLPGDVSKRMRPEELRQTQQLIDLLQRMLELDPAKRITPLDALQHPFVQ